jgi:hypothetical protein
MTFTQIFDDLKRRNCALCIDASDSEFDRRLFLQIKDDKEFWDNFLQIINRKLELRQNKLSEQLFQLFNRTVEVEKANIVYTKGMHTQVVCKYHIGMEGYKWIGPSDPDDSQLLTALNWIRID